MRCRGNIKSRRAWENKEMVKPVTEIPDPPDPADVYVRISAANFADGPEYRVEECRNTTNYVPGQAIARDEIARMILLGWTVRIHRMDLALVGVLARKRYEGKSARKSSTDDGVAWSPPLHLIGAMLAGLFTLIIFLLVYLVTL